MQISCSSQITQVTVFNRGALVQRQLVLPASALTAPTSGEPASEASEVLELVISDVTPLAEPGSIRAAIAPGGRQIVLVQSALHVPSTPATRSESGLRVRELRQQVALRRSQQARLTEQREQLLQLMPDPALRTTSLVEKVEERIADALATAALQREIQQQLEGKLQQLGEQLLELEQALAAAELAHAQTSNTATEAMSQPTRQVRIRLSGRGPVGAVSIQYVVPAARFWPTYTLRITDGGRRSTWLIEAQVAQRTGEDWSHVRLGLSTADLIYDARLPELPSLRLGRAQPAPKRGYRPPPEGLERMFAGYDQTFRYPGEPADSYTTGSTGAIAPEPMFSDLSDSDDEYAPEADGGAQWEEAAMPKPKGAPEKQKKMDLARDDAHAEPARRRSAGVLFTSRSEGGAGPPPPRPSAMPVMAAAPMAPGAAPSPPRGGGRAYAGMVGPPQGFGGGGGFMLGGMPGAFPMEEAPASSEPQDAWLHFDHLTMGGAEDTSQRGRLSYSGDDSAAASRSLAQMQLESMSPGGGLRDPAQSRGNFDHRYDADGLVKIPADGRLHRVSLLAAEGVPQMRLLCVPKERAEVYREAELQNPTDAPLLAGPVDVYIEGSLLTTAAIEHIDRGGTLRIGMGVEDRVRVARNVRSEEDVAGLLGGSTVVTSTVSIDLSSAMAQAVAVEVLERLPVTDDKSVTIELTAARPDAQSYNQAERGSPVRGGMSFRTSVPAGGKAKIEYQYRLTFPAKTEIVGGNRRD